MGINVREYCSGLVRMGSLYAILEYLNTELKDRDNCVDERNEINRYGNSLYLEYVMLRAELIAQKERITEEDEEEIRACRFTEEEVGIISNMKPVLSAS
jgi:hypothetical protein